MISASHVDLAERYLSLLKGCLTRSIFLEDELPDSTTDRELRLSELRAIRQSGRDWPPTAETMIGTARLDNLQDCTTRVLFDHVPGDLLEAGVWRGGSTILMRAILEVYGDSNRAVWVADSFEGLPAPDPAHYPADGVWDLSKHERLAVDLETVKANFERYGLLDDRVQFLVGLFKDTLPQAPLSRLALLRLDGDYYESTFEALAALYPKLSTGGFVIVDDFGLEPCRQAVMDFRAKEGIVEPITEVDWTGAYWRRSS